MSGAQTENRAGFDVDLLFSEPLQFELSEIIAAVNEDSPSCQIKDPGINPFQSANTDEVVLALFQPVEPHDGGTVKLIGVGYPDEAFRKADHTEALWRSGGFGQDAVANFKSYLRVTVDPVDDTLASRFRAARLLNAVTAVFAKLPITLAVYVTWSAHFVRPEKWVEAADKSVRGEWPLTEWVSYRAAWDAGPGRSRDFAVGYTTGLRNFLDYELQMEAAPIKPTDVLQMLLAAVWMPLEGGNVYEDGNTVGVEEGIRYRIRRRRSPDGTPQDILVLLHPESPIDVEAAFGPLPVKPTPMTEPYMRHPKKGFMQSLLGRN